MLVVGHCIKLLTGFYDVAGCGSLIILDCLGMLTDRVGAWVGIKFLIAFKMLTDAYRECRWVGLEK